MTDETTPAVEPAATVSVARNHQWSPKRNGALKVCQRCGMTYPPTRPVCYVEEVQA